MDLPFPFVIGRDRGRRGTDRRGCHALQAGRSGVVQQPGRRRAQGSFAELAEVREDLLYALPDPVDFAAMAALAHSGLTACLGIEHIGGLSAGQVVLVNGGRRPRLPWAWAPGSSRQTAPR
jgi:NADPH:quinone reductase-like Zn-dependent oxidoreductase